MSLLPSSLPIMIRDFLDEDSGAYYLADPNESTIQISDGHSSVTLDVTPEKCKKLEAMAATMREQLEEQQRSIMAA